jgi:hypothetical protein
MFEIDKADDNEVRIVTKNTKVTVNVTEGTVDAGLEVGKIEGPGEFEIGDVTIRGVQTDSKKTIYDLEIGGTHVGVIGGIEENLDDIVADVLCTSSVRAVREIEPKMVVSMGNIDGMVTDLKLAAKSEKKLKVKNLDTLPKALEVLAIV